MFSRASSQCQPFWQQPWICGSGQAHWCHTGRREKQWKAPTPEPVLMEVLLQGPSSWSRRRENRQSVCLELPPLLL